MKRLRPRSFLLVSVCAVAALGLACDAAIPTAPAGTILTISANPSQISLNGSSTITVVGRKPNGSPLNEGTEIFFSTSIGSVTPTVVTVDGDGVARATLRGDGRVGTANVTASISTTSGGGGGGSEDDGGGPSTGVGTATVGVLVGRTAGAVSLQATPSSVPESGSTVSLLALVRDDQGQPLAGVSVNFSTDVGTLASGGAFLTTNSQGEARDTLRLSEADLNTVATDSFEVSVEAASGVGIQTDEATISILRRPVANFQTEINGRTVSFRDTSTGNPTSWQWDFDFRNNNFTVDSTSQNPSFTYTEDGDYTVVLRARNTAGEGEISKVVIIRTNP